MYIMYTINNKITKHYFIIIHIFHIEKKSLSLLKKTNIFKQTLLYIAIQMNKRLYKNKINVNNSDPVLNYINMSNFLRHVFCNVVDFGIIETHLFSYFSTQITFILIFLLIK